MAPRSTVGVLPPEGAAPAAALAFSKASRINFCCSSGRFFIWSSVKVSVLPIVVAPPGRAGIPPGAALAPPGTEVTPPGSALMPEGSCGKDGV